MRESVLLAEHLAQWQQTLSSIVCCQLKGTFRSKDELAVMLVWAIQADQLYIERPSWPILTVKGRLMSILILIATDVPASPLPLSSWVDRLTSSKVDSTSQVHVKDQHMSQSSERTRLKVNSRTFSFNTWRSHCSKNVGSHRRALRALRGESLREDWRLTGCDADFLVSIPTTSIMRGGIS